MNYILLTTTRCPKCPAFKAFVADNVPFEGQIYDETCPEFMDLVQKWNATAAPVMIILDGDTEVFRTSDMAALADFLER